MHDCIPLSVRLVVPLVPQIGPPLAGQPLRFGLTPPRDLLVVSAQQCRRHIHSAIARRPGIARRRQEPVVVRIRRRRLMIPQRSREQPHHRVHHAQRRRLATRQHEVPDRQLLRPQPVRHSLIHVLVVAAQQGQLLTHREPHGVAVCERPAARRQQHGGPPPPRPQVLHRLEKRLRFEHHPRAAAVGGVVHRLVPVVRVLAQLHHVVTHQPLLRGPPRNADPQRPFEHLRKECHDVNRQHRPLPRRRSGLATAPPQRATARRRTTAATRGGRRAAAPRSAVPPRPAAPRSDRKSTRLNSSHEWISYAVFCLKKKKKTKCILLLKKKKKKVKEIQIL